MTPKERQQRLTELLEQSANNFRALTQQQMDFAVKQVDQTRQELTDRLAKYAGKDSTVKRERMIQIMKELDTIEARIREEYLDTMEITTKQTAEFVAKHRKSSLERTLGEGGSVGVAYNQLPENVVKYVATRFAADGLILSDRIWQLSGQLRDQLGATIRQGIIQGKSLNTMIADVRQVYANDTWKIKRLVLTESATAYRTADSYVAQQSKFVKGVKIHRGRANRPNHMCSILAAQDKYNLGTGVYLPTDTSILNPHPNCTSWLEYVLDEKKIEERDKKQAAKGAATKQPAAAAQPKPQAAQITDLSNNIPRQPYAQKSRETIITENAAEMNRRSAAELNRMIAENRVDEAGGLDRTKELLKIAESGDPNKVIRFMDPENGWEVFERWDNSGAWVRLPVGEPDVHYKVYKKILDAELNDPMYDGVTIGFKSNRGTRAAGGQYADNHIQVTGLDIKATIDYDLELEDFDIEDIMKMRKTLFHEAVHRFHSFKDNRIPNVAELTMRETDWKAWKEAVKPYYSTAETVIDQNLQKTFRNEFRQTGFQANIEYGLNAKKHYGKRYTRDHYDQEMLTTFSEVYKFGSLETMREIDDHFPGIFNFLESLYRRDRWIQLDPLEELPKIKTVDGFVKWAKKNLNVPNVDYSRYSEMTAKQFNLMMYRMKERYPEAFSSKIQTLGDCEGYYDRMFEIKLQSWIDVNITKQYWQDRIKAIGEPATRKELRDAIIKGKHVKREKYDGRANAFAQSSATGIYEEINGIYLDPKNAKDLARWNENKRRAANVKWSAVGTARGTMIHEFGHSLDYWLQDVGHRDFIDKMWASYSKEDVEWWKDKISEYGMTNDREMVAELFSEYILNPEPRPLAAHFGMLLEEEIAKYRKGK